MRREFEMTEAQFEELLDACKPTPLMFISGGIPISRTPQENANVFWSELGIELGFDFMTAQPSGKERFFTAETTD